MYPFFWSVTSRQNVRNWFPAFRDDAVVSYSRVDTFKKVFGSITIRSLNFGKYILSEASSHSLRTQISSTPLSKRTRKILTPYVRRRTADHMYGGNVQKRGAGERSS